MEGDNIAIVVPSSSNMIPTDIPATTQIVEEEPRVCPLCSAEIRQFFINFNDKMLMCENTECDYPFGYEELQFTSVDGGEASEVNSVRTKSRISPTATGSVISTTAWSDIDKINKVYDSEDNQPEKLYEEVETENLKRRKNNDSSKKIQKNVEEIKELNREMSKLSESKNIIKNPKWIKNLFYFQGVSGTPLLKPEELGQLKKTNVKLNDGELKINIETGNPNLMSTITIDISDNKRND